MLSTEIPSGDESYIIFNASLDDYTIGQIKSYLNKKYNIY